MRLVTIFCFIFIITLIVFALFPEFNFYVQDFFYFPKKQWLVDRNEYWGKLFFYSGVKLFIIVSCLCIAFLGGYLWAQKKLALPQKKRLIHFLLSFILVPSVVSFMKMYSGIYCPNQLLQYGGSEKLVTIFDHLMTFNFQGGHCFPGGHASAGFALLCLPFMYGHKIKYYVPGLLAGFTLGLYQMMKGDHFLSDTLVTLEISLIINAILSLFILKKAEHER